MKQTIAFILLSLLFLNCKHRDSLDNQNIADSVDPDAEEWMELFNGSDLSDWTVKITNRELGDNYNNTFRVEDGMIKAVYKDYDSFSNSFGHLFYDKSFSYYRLKLEYRFKGEQAKGAPSWAAKNSGVMLHSQSPESTSIGQFFPISIEFQFLDGLGEQNRKTANLCTPGTAVTINDSINFQHCIDSSSKSYSGEEWVSIEAIVLGDEKIIHIVEQDTVMTYTKPIIGGGLINRDSKEEWESLGFEDADSWLEKDGQPLKEGYIALQAESSPVDFRNVKLLDLCGCMDKKAKNYKSYYVKEDNSLCKY